MHNNLHPSPFTPEKKQKKKRRNGAPSRIRRSYNQDGKGIRLPKEKMSLLCLQLNSKQESVHHFFFFLSQAAMQ